ncbi:unnamed protein product [Adineta ricciae]|uniref:G-protein coupled receptors family 1 profile domain-containing protein n=1 Tax=Adineta ricciae TaxID=249248 RepID=A0A815MN95_ADIRI|nr:unnamed protein product [Adineta ricciae]CAF1418590.1 unnamed protein product [Adineta ricciae]
MSLAIVASLSIAYQQVFIYMGIPILSLGLIGGFFNTLVFLSLRTFRESSCAFYLTVMSILNMGQLLTGLLSRILISGFNIDFTRTSLFYCKFRVFFFQFSVISSLACICLATIDQYIATCTRPRWRQWSNIRLARRLLIGVIVAIIIEQISFLVFYDQKISYPSNQTVCITTSTGFDQFTIYTNSLLLGNLIPVIITFIFGSLAYRNIQQLRYRTVQLVRRELDKQLSMMVLVQIFYISWTITPQLILYIVAVYGNIRDSTVRAQINLAYAISLCLYYSFFASPFYTYIIVSERFRRQFLHVIFRIHNNHQWRPNRVHPNMPINVVVSFL